MSQEQTGAGQVLARTEKRDVTGARRGENETVLVRISQPREKGGFFPKERCFFS
jgi:hypothetical protein